MKKTKRILTIVLTLSMLLSICVYGAEAQSEPVRTEPSQGQKNIVLRARQLMEIEWTPLADRTQWGWQGTFGAGRTYVGAPYGQPVYTGYIGYAVDLNGFIAATEDNTSKFYTDYSYYNKAAPYYSTDCSGYVSYAWGLKTRCFTATLPSVSYAIENQNIEALEMGDCMNNTTSHAALVSDVVRDQSGKVVSIEIMEQTPVITQTTRYGHGGTRTLDYFSNYYFSRGYRIYRYYERDSVQYSHSCAVPLDGEWCANCRHHAPFAKTTVSGSSKSVTLSHDKAGAVIYYTMDGSDPQKGGAQYTGPITVSGSSIIRAYAAFSDGSVSRVLTYKVSVDTAAAPTYSVVSGTANGTTLSVGSSVALKSATSGVSIYYTLDGSTPTEQSAKYTSPIVISAPCTVKAIAVGAGYIPSSVSTFSFTIGSFAGFSDLEPGAWYKNAVEFVSGRGLFNGVSETRFDPYGTMTRGMFATVLGRLAGVPNGLTGRIGISLGNDVNVRSGAGTSYSVVGQVDKYDAFSVLGLENGWYKIALADGRSGYMRSDYVKPYEGAFSDLDESKYYSPYVQWLWLMGISSGTGSGGFASESIIDRESMAVMLCRYARNCSINLKTVNEKTVFSDDGAISFKDEVYTLQQAGVIQGVGNGKYDPDGSATRAQVATIFMNFVLASGG